MHLPAHQLARLEHMKADFKKQMCRDVDTLFANFIVRLTNSSRYRSAPPSSSSAPVHQPHASKQPPTSNTTYSHHLEESYKSFCDLIGLSDKTPPLDEQQTFAKDVDYRNCSNMQIYTALELGPFGISVSRNQHSNNLQLTKDIPRKDYLELPIVDIRNDDSAIKENPPKRQKTQCSEDILPTRRRRTEVKPRVAPRMYIKKEISPPIQSLIEQQDEDYSPEIGLDGFLSPSTSSSNAEEETFDQISDEELEDGELPNQDSEESENEPRNADFHQSYRVLSVNCLLSSCKAILKSHYDLQHHMKVSHGFDHYKCLLTSCELSFATRRDLQDHLENDHDEPSQWQCHKCSICVNSAPSLNYHLFHVHSEGQFACTQEQCGFIAKNRAFINQHYFKDHCSNSRSYSANSTSAVDIMSQLMRKLRILCFKCLNKKCDLEFTSQTDLYNHSIDIHRLKPEQCPLNLCGRSFLHKQDLTDHIRMDHRNVMAWDCAKCAVSLSDFAALRQHYYLAHLEGRFKCKICDFVGRTPASTVKHFDREHMAIDLHRFERFHSKDNQQSDEESDYSKNGEKRKRRTV